MARIPAVETTVFARVEVRKSAFYDAMVALESVPGVVGYGIDKNGPKSKEANGYDHDVKALPEKGKDRGRLSAVMVTALKSGPKHLKELRSILFAGGFSPGSANDTLNRLRKANIVDTDNKGTWSLTEEAKADMAKPVQVVDPQPIALPAPETLPITTTMILHYMQKHDRKVGRAELRRLLAANGREPDGVDAAVTKLRQASFAKIKEQGVYVLTALGKKQKTGDLTYTTPAE